MHLKNINRNWLKALISLFMIDSNQKKTTKRRLKKIKRKNPKRITIFYRKNKKWMRDNMKRDRWKINKNNMSKS